MENIIAKYRETLPLLNDELFLTDGGLETTLIFHEGLDLPEFAAFVLLENEKGRNSLIKYYRKYASLACENKVGFILESPTWRANPRWAGILGYSEQATDQINREAIHLLVQIRDEFENDSSKMVISGCIGPKGDGYVITEKMSVHQAENYHLPQIKTFSNTEADLVAAFTITYTEEAIGIVRASQSTNMPVVIGFTVETDGRLPSGQTIGDAINIVDKATNNYAAYYMINCAHPTHFQNTLDCDESWKQRIRAVRANASAMSHAELDEAEEIDSGNPAELGLQYKELRGQLINLNILGGCCGTDFRHVEAIFQAV